MLVSCMFLHYYISMHMPYNAPTNPITPMHAIRPPKQAKIKSHQSFISPKKLTSISFTKFSEPFNKAIKKQLSSLPFY